jgi:hypothetical protein
MTVHDVLSLHREGVITAMEAACYVADMLPIDDLDLLKKEPDIWNEIISMARAAENGLTIFSMGSGTSHDLTINQLSELKKLL